LILNLQLERERDTERGDAYFSPSTDDDDALEGFRQADSMSSY
jgi:hypothetical protein